MLNSEKSKRTLSLLDEFSIVKSLWVLTGILMTILIYRVSGGSFVNFSLENDSVVYAGGVFLYFAAFFIGLKVFLSDQHKRMKTELFNQNRYDTEDV